MTVLAPTKRSEQRKIAAALSDVDDLIEGLEALIEKKRAIKTATMQQLLTGRTRLPGFGEGKGYKETELGLVPADWQVLTIGEFAPLQRGFDLPTKNLRAGGVPVCYSNGVQNYHDTHMVKGPGVYTGRSGTIGNVHFVATDFWPHNTALWVTSFKNANPLFCFYLLSTVGLERFRGGSGVPTLNRNDVHDTKIAVPCEREQKAIGNVLEEFDQELSRQAVKLNKLRKIKQGMMQQLLTGRTRLV